MESGTVSLSGKQVRYIMEKTGEDTPDKAIEMFATMMAQEQVSPAKMGTYIDIMMEKDKAQADK